MIDVARGPNEHLIGQPGSRHELGTPSLVLDLDVLDANIASLAAHGVAHGYDVRAVAKIHKTVEISRAADRRRRRRRLLRHAARGRGDGRRRHPRRDAVHVGGDAAEAGRAWPTCNAAPTGLLVCVDDDANVAQLEAAARGSGKPLGLLVDLEVGGGRTGLADEDAAVALAGRIAASDAVTYEGVQGYVGNHQNTVDYDERRRDVARAAGAARVAGRAPAPRGSRARASSRAPAPARTTSTTSSACSPRCRAAPTR